MVLNGVVERTNFLMMEENMLNIGVIGCGYWGPKLIRNINLLKNVSLKYISDLNESSLLEIKKKYPNTIFTNDYMQILNDHEVDAVVIATPVHTHFHFAKEALRFNKHVFVEKPLTQNSNQAEELYAIAKGKNLVLMVGHVFLYTASVRKMREIIDSGVIGNVQHIKSQRLDFGLIRNDVNVLWDLAPHDISIVQYLLEGAEIKAVNAIASKNVLNIEDTASLTLTFKNGINAFIQCSWLNPEKVREVVVVGTKGMVVYDEMEQNDKVKVYTKSVSNELINGEVSFTYHQGSLSIPDLDKTEALLVELSHFVYCINSNIEPNSGGRAGIEVVKVLEAADESIKENGKQIQLNLEEVTVG